MFADDIVIYAITKNIQFARMSMTSYLNEISNFLKSWKLKMNINKCESISIVGHYKDLDKKIRKQALEAKFTIDRIIINKVKQVKYLGVVISQNFQFTDHVKHIIKKVNAAQTMLNKILNNKYIKKVVKIIIYKQLIRPLITYASPCWLIKNVISSYQIELLRKKERHFLRKCCDIFRSHNNKKYINSKILYNEARINRLDREIVKNNLNFANKSKNHEKQIIHESRSFSQQIMKMSTI